MQNQKNIQRLFPGGYFHIYNRGNNKEVIFKESENYFYFLNLWKKYIEPIGETFCYCLLPNHFHFFIRLRERDLNRDSSELSEREISKSFSNLINVYTKAVNKRCSRTGSLFQKQFKRKEIVNNSYFTSIVGYIVTNSIKHNLAKKVSEYPYSSYFATITEKPTLIRREEILGWFGGRERFIQFVNNYNEKEIIKNELFEIEGKDEL